MWGSEFTTKAATRQGGFSRNRVQLICMWALAQLLPNPRPRFIHKVLDRGAQAVVRGGVHCASQVLDRSVQAVARGAKHVLHRGVQAVSRGAARCALPVHGRGAKTDA